jgi:hypothetical protein
MLIVMREYLYNGNASIKKLGAIDKSINQLLKANENENLQSEPLV